MAGLVTGYVLDRYAAGGGERLVAIALADNAHRDGTRIFPSVAEVADRTKLSVRSVQVHIARMVAAGWLVLVRKSTGRRGDTNEYRISPEWLAGGECVPPSMPVLRTNAKKASGPWGAESAPHESPASGADSAPHSGPGWGEADCAMGCSLTHHGVQPTAPKPSLTVIEPNPPSPLSGGARGFASLVAEYPRKVDLIDAEQAYRELAPGDALLAEMIDAVRRWVQTDEWQREKGRFVPKLAKWLRKRKWLDVPGFTPAPPPPALRAPKEPERTPDEIERTRRIATAEMAKARATLRQRRAVVAAA